MSSRSDPTAETDPYYRPQGHATKFYSLHHGNRLLAVDHTSTATYNQPFATGHAKPIEKVAYLDILATGGDGTVYLHVINRHFSQSVQAKIDLAQFGEIIGDAQHHLFTGRLHKSPKKGESDAICQIETNRIANEEGTPITLTLPPRSANIVEITVGTGISRVAQ